MSSPGKDDLSNREALVEDDIACLRRLEDLGLLDVAAGYKPGRMLFRMIAHMPADYADAHGKLCNWERWPADILLEADYPQSAPAIQLADGQVVPDNEFFVARPRDLWSSSMRLLWRPPDAIAAFNRRAGDCALIFLWTVSPEIMAQVLTEHAEVFQNPPLDRLTVLTPLLAQAEALMAKLRAEGATHTSEPPPQPERDRVSRKFAIREIQDQATVATDLPPTGYKLISQARDPGDDNVVYLTASALQEIFNHIEWGLSTERNVREQGGVLVGLRCREPDGGGEFVRVTNALPVHSDERSAAYVKFDHGAWNALLNEFDLRKEQGMIAADALIVGWYHTHPNALDCFMSGTDRITQRSVFHRPWNYALVLNPQRRLIASFVGAESQACGVAVSE